jgi:hypothetical protein
MHQLFQGPQPWAEAGVEPPTLAVSKKPIKASAAKYLFRNISIPRVLSFRAVAGVKAMSRLKTWPECDMSAEFIPRSESKKMVAREPS